MLTVDTPTRTRLYEVDDSHDDRFCHIVSDDDSGWLCGQSPRGGGEGRRTHVTRRPTDRTCDGCGRPRCPKCRELVEGGA